MRNKGRERGSFPLHAQYDEKVENGSKSGNCGVPHISTTSPYFLGIFGSLIHKAKDAKDMLMTSVPRRADPGAKECCLVENFTKTQAPPECSQADGPEAQFLSIMAFPELVCSVAEQTEERNGDWAVGSFGSLPKRVTLQVFISTEDALGKL